MQSLQSKRPREESEAEGSRPAPPSVSFFSSQENDMFFVELIEKLEEKSMKVAAVDEDVFLIAMQQFERSEAQPLPVVVEAAPAAPLAPALAKQEELDEDALLFLHLQKLEESERETQLPASFVSRSTPIAAASASVPKFASVRDCGLPVQVVEAYEKKGVSKFYEWQASCLSIPGVMEGLHNLVYSAPTSGGKTLCADVLLAKRVFDSRRKGLFIVPIVTLAEEKTRSLRQLLPQLVVEGYYRNGGDGFLDTDPNGGADVAVCTIEKASHEGCLFIISKRVWGNVSFKKKAYHLVNRIIEKGQMDQLAVVVLDEAHIVADSPRGALVETILTKVRFFTKKCQIVCMSATMPNPNVFESWLNSKVFCTKFRPVALTEHIIRDDGRVCLIARSDGPVGGARVTEETVKQLAPMRMKQAPGGGMKEDLSKVWSLCRDAAMSGRSVLVFCGTRFECSAYAGEAMRRIQEDASAKEALVLKVDPATVDVREEAVARLTRSSSGANAILCQLRETLFKEKKEFLFPQKKSQIDQLVGGFSSRGSHRRGAQTSGARLSARRSENSLCNVHACHRRQSPGESNEIILSFVVNF